MSIMSHHWEGFKALPKEIRDAVVIFADKLQSDFFIRGMQVHL
jgi:hypothetical protein